MAILLFYIWLLYFWELLLDCLYFVGCRVTLFCLFLSLCVSAVDLFIWYIELQAQILLVFRGLKLHFEVIKQVCNNYETPETCRKSKVLVLYRNSEFVFFISLFFIFTASKMIKKKTLLYISKISNVIF